MGEQVPGDDAGFLEFARSLPKPELFLAIRDTEPLSPIIPYQFSANLRRHYEELPRFPEGFLPFGDSLCSFNPLYGQGMTVACIEALILGECLAAGTQRLAQRFFRKSSAHRHSLADHRRQRSAASSSPGDAYCASALHQLVHCKTLSCGAARRRARGALY